MINLAENLAKYKGLPVSVKLLFLPLALFLSLWATGAVGFIIFANNNLEQMARKETAEMALWAQQNFQQTQKTLSLQTRWISKETEVIEAISRDDRTLLSRTLLLYQNKLDLDLIRIKDTQGTSLVSLQKGVLGVAQPDPATHSSPPIGLGSARILSANDSDPITLLSSSPIESPTQVLATLFLGCVVDNVLLHQIRGDTSMHLVVLQGARIAASTLPMDRNQPWQFPQSEEPVTWMEIAGETYFVKTVRLLAPDQTNLRIAVLNSIQDMEQAEQKIFLFVGVFGLLGGLLVFGMTVLGIRISQGLSRRIQSLNQATQQLAQGDLTIRIPVATQDEVGSLAQGFNTMAQQLTVRDQQLNQQMQTLKSTLDKLHRTQSQLVQTEKMSALGQMMAGIAHEINNPANFIHANLHYAAEYTQDLLRVLDIYQHYYPQPPAELQSALDDVDLEFLSEDLTKLLKSMKVGSDRIRNIVISLRNFSRLDEAEFKSVDLHEGIDNTLMILQHRLKARPEFPAIEVVKNYSDLPIIECYPGHLNQVFMNLLANAIDALEEAAKQTNQSHSQSGSGTIWISTHLIADSQVRIIVADDGLGMSESVRSHIFDPFFTTKPIGKGTGLGLSISHQIVTEKHLGKIWCDSTLGEGSKFVLEIPIRHPSYVPEN